MDEGLLQRRAATTAGRLEPIERDEDIQPRPKTHFPFVTKIQVRIKRGETESERSSRNDESSPNEPSIQPQSVRPKNFTLREPPVTRPNSRITFSDEESMQTIESRREAIDEIRKRRLQILGKRASASTLVKPKHETDSLYRPQFSTKDCGVQLLLVRELTQHLEYVERETRSAQVRHSQKRLPVFHNRATKGQRIFGYRKWNY